MPYPRLEKLYQALKAAGLDAVAINPGPTLHYLTGLNFHLMERPVVLLLAPGHEPALVLPELEMLKVNRLPYPVQAFAYSENPAEWPAAFNKAMQSMGADGKRLGVEPRALRLLEFRLIQGAAPEADYPDASQTLGSLRLRKEADEVEKMRKAVKIAQDALQATLPLIKIGMTEKDIESQVVLQLLRHGSGSAFPFSPVVCAGPNSARPHAAPSERKIQAGDVLLFDWGAAYEGYCSDLTRTFAVGAVEAEFRKIHQVVLEANAAGRAAGKPGVPCADVDKAARAVITKAGYGEYFRHRTGHGLGLEVHEDPYLRGDNLQLLEPGMTYTVEPGIYLAGRNGVRIEDDVVITATGAESLSDMERELREVG